MHSFHSIIYMISLSYATLCLSSYFKLSPHKYRARKVIK